MKTKPRGEIATVKFMVEGKLQAAPHASATAIVWEWADKAPNTEVLLAAFPENVRAQAAQFGLKTKLRNATAGALTAAQGREDLLALLDVLKGGDWAGERGPNFALLPDALAQVLSITREEAEAKLVQREGEDAKAYNARRAKIASEPRIAKALVDLKPKGEPVDLDKLMAA